MCQEPRVYLIGNAHIDPVWLWRWQQGFAEIKASFQSALDRMEEFPDFVFTCACAAYYQWVEENAPEMFEQIRRRVAQDRWVPVGGWWIQPDCNAPGGESFFRHGLYSQRYFLQKFGRMAKIGYNVDSFGHNATLPQILRKSGMEHYVFMRPMADEKTLPGSLFDWESSDGSRVRAFRLTVRYNDGGPEELARRLSGVREQARAEGTDFMCFYGVGNHGGGPTIASLRALDALRAAPGGDSLVFGSPEDFFAYADAQKYTLPVVKGDLQHHASGCYSAHSEIKAANRRAEHRLMSAEKWSVLAHTLLAAPYPGENLRRAWDCVLFNQFHDIMGGCSIREAYSDAAEAHGTALYLGAQALNAALQRVSWAVDTKNGVNAARSKEGDWKLWTAEGLGTPLVVFNPLSWPVDAPIQIGSLIRGVTDESGAPLPVQTVRASRTNGHDKWDALFIGRIPAFGYRTYWLHKDQAFDLPAAAVEPPRAEGCALENAYTRLRFDPDNGGIAGWTDKRRGLELLSPSGTAALVLDETAYDTWAHGVFSFRDEIGRFGDAQFRVVENGPVRAVLRVTSFYGTSELRQDYVLYAHRPDLTVRVRLDWRERHKMLKLSFPVNAEDPVATYDIAYGHLERPAGGTEEHGQQWVDVSGKTPDGGTLGLALLNDGKYSFDILGGDLRMTVVRSPIFADHFGQGQRDGLEEYTDQGVQEFRYSLLPHAGDWRTADVVRRAYELNVPPEQVTETYHDGPLPQKAEGIRVGADNVIATALKRAEDGGGTVLRFVETAGQSAEAEIELPTLNRRFTANFGPCEIKTFYLDDDLQKPVREVNLIEL